MPVPAGHWLVVYDDAPFEVCLSGSDGTRQLSSVGMENVHVASFGPMTRAGRYQLGFRERGDKESSAGVVLKLLVQILAMNRLIRQRYGGLRIRWRRRRPY